MASAVPRLSRDEFARKKAIEEARKAGTLAPEVDNEGNMINPHVPEYMAKAPWYLNQEAGAGLKHQRLSQSRDDTVVGIDQWVRRGVKKRRAARFRKGACKNCGAMTHAAKDCTERPRRVGAWKTERNIAPDEYLPQDLELSWDGRRDRWNGFNPAEHIKVVERFREAEAERRRQRMLRMKDKARAKATRAKGQAGGGEGEGEGEGGEEAKGKDGAGEEAKGTEGGGEEAEGKGGGAKEGAGAGGGAGSGSDSDSDSDAESEEDGGEDEEVDDVRRGDEESAMPGAHIKRALTKAKMTVRNLRVREDLPKYLMNLDPNSAYFDPKTRAMRGNPFAGKDASSVPYAGDNAVRGTGEASQFLQSEAFAWEVNKRGKNVNTTADPTAAAVLRRQFAERKGKVKEDRKKTLLDTYGGAEHMKAPPRELLLGETENYVEYSRDGRVVKGAPAAVPRSKYEEDVHPLNHSSVWGSYFDPATFRWGYACCGQCERLAYCTGAAGRRAVEEAQRSMERALEKVPERKSLPERGDKQVAPHPLQGHGADLYGEQQQPELDRSKLQDAIQRAKQVQRDDPARQTGYSSVQADKGITAEDIEAFNLVKQRPDDPMANYVDEGAGQGAGPAAAGGGGHQQPASEAGSGSESDSSSEKKERKKRSKRRRRHRRKESKGSSQKRKRRRKRSDSASSGSSSDSGSS